MNHSILLNLRKFLVPEIVYGEGAINLAGLHCKNFGASKVLIVSDQGVRDAGWTRKVEESISEAGLDSITFSAVTPNPKDHEVMAGTKVYLESGCDLIVAVGGGSPMDCAKGIGIVATNGGTIAEYEGIDEVTTPVPPLVFIPTTAGSSADVSQFAIITDTTRNVKIAIISKMVIPDIALVDPLTTTTMSPELTAETGMDALCHAFEAYVSTVASPLTDMAALSAAQLAWGNLRGARFTPEDKTYRNNMMMASLMAGLAFSNASLGIVHALAHSLGGAFGLPHGECNAILLEKVVLYNYSAASKKYDRLAEAMGIEISSVNGEDNSEALANALQSLRKDLNITNRLIDLGVKLPDIRLLAEFALKDPCVASNPREATQADLEEILLQVYN